MVFFFFYFFRKILKGEREKIPYPPQFWPFLWIVGPTSNEISDAGVIRGVHGPGRAWAGLRHIQVHHNFKDMNPGLAQAQHRL